jgi:hypothetical protein
MFVFSVFYTERKYDRQQGKNFDVELHLFVRVAPGETMTSQREIEVGRDLVRRQGGRGVKRGKWAGPTVLREGERGV